MSVAYPGLQDDELVRLSQEGDTRAFDELVKRYQEKVYRQAFKILRHEEDAAEALQDAFLSAYRGLKNFKKESTFSTWLYRVATNAALMRYRRRRNPTISLDQSQSPLDDAEPMEIPDWSAQPLEQLLDTETREVLYESLLRLPEDLADVFIKRDIDGWSNAEVAEAIGISVAAVKSRLHRARVGLREDLDRYFKDRLKRRDRRPSSGDS